MLSETKTWKRLAAGGMSEVFLAQRRRDDGRTEPVVVKVLLPTLLQDPRAVEMFQTEADLVVLLRHPNIVCGLDRGTMAGRPYLVLEYVDGPDLAALQARVRKEGLRLDPAVAVQIAVQALRGLHHAHESRAPNGRPLGLVHRDISPENLFCTRHGVVKVADFGVAKLVGLEMFTDPSLGIRGKLAFMAPERARGEIFDGRSDAFSLALILYELLGNVRPFEARPGESPVDQGERVAAGEIPPLHSVNGELPRSVCDVVMKALRPRARDRWAHCGEFADALRYVAYQAHLLAGQQALADWIEELFPRQSL